MKKVKSGSDISFSFNVKVTDKTTVDEIIREASDIIKVRFAEYKVEPEESEDERVIKALETFINQPEIADKITFEARIEWLDWLEKQKKQKPEEKQDYSGLNDLERAIHRGFLSAGVENVPVTIIKETAQECLAQMEPAAWSEEDEEKLNSIFSILHYVGNFKFDSWIKSLPERFSPEPKQEWSEEDEDIRDTIIRDLKHLGGDITNVKPAYKTEIDWLKSLRPQSHWKPKEQQLDCLRHMINVSTVGKIDKQLVQDLYEQLKNL